MLCASKDRSTSRLPMATVGSMADVLVDVAVGATVDVAGVCGSGCGGGRGGRSNGSDGECCKYAHDIPSCPIGSIESP